MQCRSDREVHINEFMVVSRLCKHRNLINPLEYHKLDTFKLQNIYA